MAEYGIWQLKKENFHGRAFRGYEEVVSEFGPVKMEDYECVYAFESEKELGLDDLFYIFNMEHPKDYRAHSLSVSDVVETPEGFFFCDSFGWKKLDWEVR